MPYILRMSVLPLAPTALARLRGALAARIAMPAVQRHGTQVSVPVQVLTTVDQWIGEEQWLAGFPVNRSEQFGLMWRRGP